MQIDISDLGEVEQWIAIESVNRLRTGQKVYGQWKLGAKDNFFEAVLEVLDRNNYMGAEKAERSARSADEP